MGFLLLMSLSISLYSETITLVKPNILGSRYEPQYISERVCESILKNLNETGEAYMSNITTQQGVAYSMWFQCYPNTTSICNDGSNNCTSAIGNIVTIKTRIESDFRDVSIFDILTDDTIANESPDYNKEVDYDRTNVATPNNDSLIHDKRYTYMLDVARQCEPQLLGRCASYRVGLLAQENDTECPICGLSDANCDNVHQCRTRCGQIRSINYPMNYGNNHRCRWSIRAPNSFYVNLSVIDFDIPSANNATKLGTCIFDYLTFIDGYTGKRIGCYCNENLPPPFIVSPWNELIIQFDTNSEVTGRGFYFEYELMRLELSEPIKRHFGSNFLHKLSSESGSESSNIKKLPMELCLKGWHYFHGNCYRAYNEVEPLQWYDAESKCTNHANVGLENLDGHLVSILDKDEMLVIHYLLTNVWRSPRYREYYIGLIDVSREGVYRWSDNNPMSYTDWELKPMLLEDETPAQPDGGAYEDCTVIRYNSFSRTSNWHDVPCSLGKHYHAHYTDKTSPTGFKWDYVSSYICKSSSRLVSSALSGPRIRRPLFSNEFKPALYANAAHLAGISNSNNWITVSRSNQKTTPQATDNNPSTGNARESSQNFTLGSNETILSPTSGQRTRYFDLASLDDNRYFVCDNLEVISVVLRCDGVAHCRDGSDESHGCDQDCLDWQFRCANGRCISIGFYCDFVDDCGDGSDESRCERRRCKLNEFKCQSGQCISSHQRCDLIPDCSDGSDEGQSCMIGSNCNPSTTFQCYNGNCIPTYAVCDFQIDCPGKFHEDEHETICDSIQKSNAVGLHQHKQAAPSNTPVVFYPASQVEAHSWTNMFQCTSGNLISRDLRCLYEIDRYGYQTGCRDVSHLIDCAIFKCPEKDFVKCQDSYCIPWRYVCDGKWDCLMGDDEVGCARYVCPGQYKCANQSSCILLHQLCDGIRQCPMGDDEWFCDLNCPRGCDCIGQSVNCRGANMTHLPSNYIPKSVRKLDLSYNQLGPNLSSCNFDSYHDLGELILHHNGIEVLIPRKFHQLRNLYKLDLSHNQIHSVKRGAFAGLRRVTQLLLESNQQLFLLEPEAFLGLSSLQMLNISSSRIQSLKKNTFDGLTSLRHLLLRSNQIINIEEGAFRTLNSLVGLDMRGNDIQLFTKNVFSDLKSMRYLSTDSFKFCCLMNHQIPTVRCLPLPDEISDCEDLLSSVPQRTCIWMAGGIAVVGNLIVTVWRYREYMQGQKEREAEQVNSLLLLSLGCSDLLMGIYLIVIAGFDMHYRGRYIENADQWRKSFVCSGCGFLSTVSSFVSVFTLVFIAYNRYLEICKSFKTPSKFTTGYTQRLILASWSVALLIASVSFIWPYAQGKFYARSGVCLAFHITDQPRAAGWFYSVLVSPCVNLIAFVFISVCYARIYQEISEASRRTLVSPNHKIKIVLIVLTHFVAFSPPVILAFMSLAGYRPPATVYSWIAVLVLPVNSAINPMIYTIPNIRYTITDMILNYRTRKQRSALAVAPASNSSARKENQSYRPVSINGQNSKKHSEQQVKEWFGKPLAIELRHQKHAKRNIPPGYMPLERFLLEKNELNPSKLVEISLGIAQDIEEKHRDSKVYASLTLDDIYVADNISGLENPGKLFVFVADHSGYKHKKSHCGNEIFFGINTGGQTNSVNSTANNHQWRPHSHHCECNDVKRFGEILEKIVKIYSHRKSDDHIFLS